MKEHFFLETSPLHSFPADSFLDILLDRGFNFFSGLPCSIQADLINAAINRRESNYVPASSEGDAVAIASGAWLAGKKSVVLCQNSGLFDLLGSVSSILLRFKIPLLLFISWRGHEEGSSYPLGKITVQSLEILGIDFRVLTKETSIHEIKEFLEEAGKCIENKYPFVFLVQRGVFDSKRTSLPPILNSSEIPKNSDITNFIKKKDNSRLTREDFFSCLQESTLKESVYLANEGYSSRQLFLKGDNAKNFYLVPLGHVASLALGIALHTSKMVTAIDGDGALLMRLGSLAILNIKKPKNFVHIVLDNGVYSSTGGQISAAHFMDLSRLASNFGYSHIFKINDQKGLNNALSFIKEEGPYFLHVKVSTEESPTVPLNIPTTEMGAKFRKNITVSNGAIP